MDRLFAALLLGALLACAALPAWNAQPVFFSLLFPQLMPGQAYEATPGEAVFL